MSAREQAGRPTIPARLRRSLARRFDALALNRARTLADRVARGRYPEPQAERLRRTFASLEDQARAGLPTREYVERIAEAYAELWDSGTGAILPSETLRRATIDQFHRLYYHSPQQTWKNTFYRGVPVWKCPLDLWLYQEILHEVRPDLIIETGTAHGGSAYYLADLCSLLDRGEVVSIDVKDRTNGLAHPRITFLIGSSTDPETKRKVLPRIPEGGTVLVILDSLHTRRHVLAEMRLWNDLVSVGSYLIVEDTNINGHPVRSYHGPGPWEAVQAFRRQNDEFLVDDSMHKFLMTQNPHGYLRRVRPPNVGTPALKVESARADEHVPAHERVPPPGDARSENVRADHSTRAEARLPTLEGVRTRQRTGTDETARRRPSR